MVTQKKFALFAGATLFAAAFLAASANGQMANTTTITGTITDSSGASVSDVAVKAVNNATSDTYNVKTSGDGNFTIPFVKVGTYSVTASKSGFSSVVQDNVQVDANQIVRTNFTLQVGSLSQNIVVTAATPAIATDNADLEKHGAIP